MYTDLYIYILIYTGIGYLGPKLSSVGSCWCVGSWTLRAEGSGSGLSLDDRNTRLDPGKHPEAYPKSLKAHKLTELAWQFVRPME